MKIVALVMIVCGLIRAKPGLLVIDSTPPELGHKSKPDRKALDIKDLACRLQTWIKNMFSFSSKNMIKIENEQRTKKLYMKMINAENG